MQAIETATIRAARAQEKYGDFASTHEALGVIAEEYAELIEAVRSNCSEVILQEALDIAAACLRLAHHCEAINEGSAFWNRSGFTP